MKYPDGTEARLGDRIRFSNGATGTIVLSADTAEYGSDFPKEDWPSVTKGILAKMDNGALVSFCDPNIEEIFLQSRALDDPSS